MRALLGVLLLLLAATHPCFAGPDIPLYSARELTANDLQGRTLRELSLMRNTIYARAGHRFRKKWLADYFAAQPWYKPLAKEDDSQISAVDRKNAKLLASFEAAQDKQELARRRDALVARQKAGPLPAADDIELQLLSDRLGAGSAAAAEAPGETDGLKYPESWTDPRVVAALARNCQLPDSLRGMNSDGGPGERPPLECGPADDQSCVYDPCFSEGEEQCKPRCRKVCETCNRGCLATCQTCRRACQGGDAACIHGCAQHCAECHQECIEQSDRCGSATCTEQYRACRARLKADWTKNKCPATCARYRACQARCPADDTNCRDRCKKGRSGCNLGLCPGEDSMGINPESDD
jgi:hypothetical protein